MGVLFQPVTEQPFNSLSDAQVKFPALTQEDRVIRRLPCEVMLEDIFQLWDSGDLTDQFSALQHVELAL